MRCPATEHTLAKKEKNMIMPGPQMDTREPKCLDRTLDGNRCEGPVEYRMPLSGTGKSSPRCDKHWEQRLDRQAEIDRRYPDSPIPPSDFDPAYAGESWDGDY